MTLVPLFLALSASGQVKETIDVTLIEVPVVVSSANGEPVRGLTKNNFTILDNGKPRPIASFDVVDFGRTEKKSAMAVLNPAARRSFLLLFDLANATPNSITRAQEAARDFVSSSLEPADLVAVATIDVEHGFRLLTSFTTDRHLIASAIEKPASFRSADPFGIANQTTSFVAQIDQPGMANLGNPIPDPIPTQGGPLGLKGMGDARRKAAERSELNSARNIAHLNEGLVRQRVEQQLEALAQLASTLAPAPGRKQVVLLSEGMPASYLTGRDARDAQEAAEQAERIMRNNFGGIGIDVRREDFDQDQRFGASSTLSLLGLMQRYFRRSDVIMHAIDTQGIRVQGDTYSGRKTNSNNGLAELARATGGQMFENVNNVGENFRRLLRRQEVVYILGFYAPSGKPGTFHELKVKLTGAPRRTQVEARAGYYEGDRAATQRALTDAEVIVHDAAEKGIQIAAFAAAFPSTAEHAQVPVVVEIDGDDLADATLLASEATLAVYAFDEQGTVRDRLFDTLTFDRAASSDRLRERGVKYYGTLRLPPGRYAVKTLLRVAKNGRRGYARTDLHVPQPGEFSVVPFVIDERPSSWVMVKGTSHDAAADVYPFQIKGQPLMPAVLPRVAAGDAKRVALFIQNAPEQLTFEAIPTATLVESAKTGQVTKIILQLAPVEGGVGALNIVVHPEQGDALRARLPIIAARK